MVAFGHIGGAVVWFLGVYRNHEQFPTVSQKFPYSSLICIPFFLLIVWGLYHTTVRLDELSSALEGIPLSAP